MSSVIPAVSNLSPKIIRILGCNPGTMTLQGTNTYLIGTGKSRILVDTGDPNKPDYIENLKKTVNLHNVKLQSIVVTHWHRDHVGGLSDVFDNITTEQDCQVYKLLGDSKKENSNITSEMKKKLNYLSNGSVLKTEGASLRVVHTPGHTDDHLVLLLEEENSLFSGDCILGEGTAVFEDLYTYMKSLELILSLNPEVIYPGHGPVINNPITKIKEYINHRTMRENQILDKLSSQKDKLFTIEELTEIIYKDTPKTLHKAASGNLYHHLLKLIKEDRVERLDSTQFKIKI